MKTWFAIKNQAAAGDDGESADVLIYDVIGAYGCDASALVSLIKASDAKTINVHLNSPGGNVFDGLAIYNALKAHPANVVTHVDGCAASIASVVAMAGDEVCIADAGMLMIHNPSAWASGDSDDLRRLADTLDKCRDSLAGIYAKKSGRSADQFKTAMAAETWYTAAEAKAAGLVDTIEGDDGDGSAGGDDGDSVTNLASFDFKIFALEPGKLRSLVTSRLRASTESAAGAAANPPAPPPPVCSDRQPAQRKDDMDLTQFNAFAATHPEAVTPLVSDAVNKAKAELSVKPATVNELKAAFGDNTGFVLDQLGAGATLAQAKAAYGDLIAAENKELKKKVTELTAQLEAETKPFGGVRTPMEGQGGRTNGGAGGSGATVTAATADGILAKFEAAVKLKTDQGMSRAKAVAQIGVENQALMDEYTAAKQAKAGAVRKSRAEQGLSN